MKLWERVQVEKEREESETLTFCTVVKDEVQAEDERIIAAAVRDE